jgi:predicted ATPase
MPYLTQLRIECREESGFPFSIPSVRDLANGIDIHPKVTYLVGENGMGKSTLLEGLADKWGFSMQSGNRSQSPGMRGYETELAPAMTLARTSARPMDGFFLRAESFYNFATQMDELEKEPFCANGYFSYGGKSLHEQSHGESFFSLFLNRFNGHGLYLLDEPEAALSPTRQMAFLVRMHDLLAECSQFVIATHSPIVLAYPDSFIYEFHEDGIRKTQYDETQAVMVTRRFMRDPNGMVDKLISENIDDGE